MSDRLADIEREAKERRTAWENGLPPHLQVDAWTKAEAAVDEALAIAKRLTMQLEHKQARIAELRGGELERLQKSYGEHLDRCDPLHLERDKALAAARALWDTLKRIDTFDDVGLMMEAPELVEAALADNAWVEET